MVKYSSLLAIWRHVFGRVAPDISMDRRDSQVVQKE